MKTLKTIAQFFYIETVLTKNDIKELLNKFEFWRIFGGATLLFISIMFLRALQKQDHLPFLSIIISVPIAIVIFVIAIVILTSKKEEQQ